MTNESESLVEKAIEQKNMKFPVAMVKTPEETAYGIKGFPTSFLLDVDGSILWKGHPGSFDEDFTIQRLEKALERTFSPPAAPAQATKSVEKALRKGNYSKAYTEVSKKLKRDAGNAELKAFLKKLQSHVTSRLEVARTAEVEGEYGRALRVYEAVLDGFGEVPGAETAKAALDALKRNKLAKDDLAAAKKWTSAMSAWRKGDFEKALKNVASIARKYADTPTGKQAAEMLARHDT